VEGFNPGVKGLMLFVFFPYVTVVCVFSGPPHELHRINRDSGLEFDLYCSGVTSVENRWEIEHVLDSLYLLRNGCFFIGNMQCRTNKYFSLCLSFDTTVTEQLGAICFCKLPDF
jgi:hypothetical protein